MNESWEEFELNMIINDRFKAERHPEELVDGTDRWGFDPFDEQE